MKVSTNCHYATIALMYMAIHQGNGPVPLKDIAKRHFVSVRHLARAMVPLLNAGIVYSYRGLRGGFALKKAAEEINIGDVYRIFEGSYAIVDDTKDKPIYHSPDFCSVNYMWEEIQDRIADALSSRTIGDLVKLREQWNKQTNLAYAIRDEGNWQEQYNRVLPS